jgi:GDP-L-fucose synthase
LLYSEDLAGSCLFFLNKKTKERIINIGSSIELTINDYAKFIIKNLGANIKINYDRSMMDGTPRKKLDCTLLKSMISFDETPLDEGLKISYQDFLKHKNG